MAVSSRSLKAFNVVDGMPRELRDCVHEFGYEIVAACLQAGVKQPNRIRNLVREIWQGARQPSQHKVNGVRGSLDWLLIQAGAEISAATLVRFFEQNHMLIVPMEPTTSMIEASMDAVNHMGVVSKSRKHQNRLRAANRAGAKQIWPMVFK